jgi:hypothetical protein
MTGCTCSEFGWCTRHKVYKGPHFFHLCQHNDRYFQAWEEGRGPGQKNEQLAAVAAADTRIIWDCPACGTRHALAEQSDRVCICGTTRLLSGEVVDQPTTDQVDQVRRMNLDEYSHSTTGVVLRWGRAIGRWVAYGRPTRTAAQIAEVWAICQACEFLAPSRDRCSICDCRVSLTAAAIFNKVAMGTEACPKKKWESTVESIRNQPPCKDCGFEKRKIVWAAKQKAKEERSQRRDRRRRRKERAARRNDQGRPDASV